MVSLAAYDVDGDNQIDLVCGWNHCKIDARNWQTGEVTFKDIIGRDIANVTVGDWLNVGRDQMIVCSTHGQCTTYQLIKLRSI